ncbi:hypothetical protein A9Q99_27515 [Gammaproteobacteria bacterium 45_16_T64]|nr:hypothetical protein A9Q99_27515 [Gammaproteobacteria bacterium 45_16_T64]
MTIKRKKTLLSLGLIFVISTTSSCGYMLHPDRVGQKGGEIDPAVIILDAAGLLFGILPGVVAFAVDITTGAVYLAPGEQSVIDKHKNQHSSITVPSFSPLHMDTQPLSDTDRALSRINITYVAEQLSSVLGQTVDAHQLSFYRPRLPVIVAARPNTTTKS